MLNYTNISKKKEVLVLNIQKIVNSVFCVLISMIAFLGNFSTGIYAEAGEDDTEEFLYNGNIYYQINESNEITITRARASVTEAVIPCEIDGMIVTEIRSSAFQGKTRLTKAVIPETVTSIGDYAFYQCTRLEEVVIPDSVENVGWNILKDTPWLQNQPHGCVIVGRGTVIGYNGEDEQIDIPQGVTSIAGCAFENLKNIISVSLPESVVSIGELAFSGCTQLTECIIPDSVKIIGAYAFNWCEALQTVNIADSVETIGNHAFLGCKSLISVNLPKNISKIEAAAFCGCTNLTKIDIPASVKEIGNQAFMECSALREVTLRRNVEFIGEDAFKGCFELQKLTIYNGSCKIVDSEKTIEACTAIYGLNQSSAQNYAQRYDRIFVTAEPLAGDMNENGEIDLSDASYLLLLYASLCGNIINDVSYFDMAAGDMNENGVIDIGDATIVLNIYANHCAGLID